MYSADARHPNPVLAEKLQALYELRGGPTIDLTIRQPYRDLLAALGDPHRHLPPVIHVAGTNGKGSVIAMLRSIFEAAGYKVHVYTSPHLIRFNERIVIAGKEIEDPLLESLLDETVAANRGGSLTFFEITTAMAFLAFARTPADICLLETGLGGRLDCTNVIEKPLATIITRIGYDHMEFLGDTLEKIAAEKAGIMKPGVPCIIAPQQDATVYDTLQSCAQKTAAPLFLARSGAATPQTNMQGPHQRDNTAAVLETLQNIKGFNLPDSAIESGLQNVRWPGRLQKIENWPGLPPGAELWIDGGHNESAAQALAAQAALWQQQDGKPLHLVIGMMKTKDPQAFLKPLSSYLQSITAISIPGEALAFDAADLAAMAQTEKAVAIHIAETPLSAINKLIRQQQSPLRIIIAGSLYLFQLVR